MAYDKPAVTVDAADANRGLDAAACVARFDHARGRAGDFYRLAVI